MWPGAGVIARAGCEARCVVCYRTEEGHGRASRAGAGGPT